MTCLLFLSAFSISWAVASSAECTDSNLAQCKTKVSVHGQPPAVVPWYSEAVVKDICSRYEEFVQCLQAVLPSCIASTKAVYEGLRDVYNFICNDGFEDYLQYQPCFANPGVQSEAAHCNRTLVSKLTSLKTYNTSYRRARLCQYSDDYIDCIGNVIKSFCSLAAETWQKKFDTINLCPYLVPQGCLGWATQCRAIGISTITPNQQQVDTPTWFIIVLSLSIALASLVIVAAVVILACLRFCPSCRRRRSSQQQEQQQASRRSSLRIDMPPPYPGPFIPGQVTSVVGSGSPIEPMSPSIVWAGSGMGDADAADEATGGVDVEKKLPLDDDDGEGYFVPDAVEMNAKLAEAIPPPPNVSYEQQQRRYHHRQRRYDGDDNSGFVPDDAVLDRSTRYRGSSPVTSPATSVGSGGHWRRQTSAGTVGLSGSSLSSSLGGGGAFSGSASSRRCSPPSFNLPSTASTSLSSQCHLVLQDDDDPETTQTSVDYY